jgi:hypothetical protein
MLLLPYDLCQSLGSQTLQHRPLHAFVPRRDLRRPVAASTSVPREFPENWTRPQVIPGTQVIPVLGQIWNEGNTFAKLFLGCAAHSVGGRLGRGMYMSYAMLIRQRQ